MPLNWRRTLSGAEMAHAEVHAAVRRGSSRPHFGVDRARNDVARRALAARVVTLHEALAVTVREVASGAAQPFLQHGAGHARVRAGEEAGRMELHHLHVAQRQAETQGHREAVAALVARRCVVAVHRRAAAGGEQHRFRLHENVVAGADVDQEDAGKRSVVGRDEVQRAMLFQPMNATRPHLLGEAVHDLDAGEVALVHRAVERLPGERLLVNRAVGIAVEEAAELVLELADPLDCAGDERPGEVLVRQPLPALDRVHEMALDRIARRQRDVVAALDHPRAAAFAEKALDRDRHMERGIGGVRMQRREESGAAGAQDQEIGAQAAHHGRARVARIARIVDSRVCTIRIIA